MSFVRNDDNRFSYFLNMEFKLVMFLLALPARISVGYNNAKEKKEAEKKKFKDLGDLKVKQKEEIRRKIKFGKIPTSIQKRENIAYCLCC